MQDITKFVGLDVSKDAMAVAIADEGRDISRYFGQMYASNQPHLVISDAT